MAMGNGDGQPSDWRESTELMQARDSAASFLASVERLLIERGMPPENRILLTRTERRRLLEATRNPALDSDGDMI